MVSTSARWRLCREAVAPLSANPVFAEELLKTPDQHRGERYQFGRGGKKHTELTSCRVLCVPRHVRAPLRPRASSFAGGRRAHQCEPALISAYWVRRIAQVPVLLLAVLFVTFSVVYFLPGDPSLALVGPEANPADIERVRLEYGFDKPLIPQFAGYVSRVLRGDLGDSYGMGQPVANVIKTFARPTLLLTGTALVLSTVVGTLLALWAVRKPFGWLDKSITTGMLVVYAIPGFWLAQLAILWVVLELNVLPIGGYSEFGRGAPSGLWHLLDVARHLALPALVLAVTEVAAVVRVLRSGLLSELATGYVSTARAKGLSEERVMSHHVLRNALLPMITVIGTRVGFLLSGATIVETIFVWPGLGSVLVAAVDRNDRPLMLGMVVVASTSVVLANLVTDLVYRWVDPRIRYD